MLIIVSLLKDEHVKSMEKTLEGVEREFVLKNVDPTTESLSLATNAFGDMSLETQKHIKKSIEHIMVPLGRLLMSACEASITTGDLQALIKIIEIKLGSAQKQILKLVRMKERQPSIWKRMEKHLRF